MVEDGAIQTIARIARIADEPTPIAERARRILHVLGRILPYDAAAIALRDPDRRIRVPLASSGDVTALLTYWTIPEADPELDRFGLNTPRPPLLHNELPVPTVDTEYWSRYLSPAGVGGALDAALFSADGRHIGHLTAVTASADRLTAAHRDLLAGLTPWVAQAIDRLPTIRSYAGIVPNTTAGVVLTNGGNTLALPGLSTDLLLAADSPVVAEAAARLAAGEPYATFLFPAPGAGADGALLRISVLDCGVDAADHMRAVVLISREPDPRGLSRHDLRVLGLLVEGWEDDEQIAASLHTTADDVAESVRRSMHRLGAPTRTGLAVHALREGLFLPRRLSGARG